MNIYTAIGVSVLFLTGCTSTAPQILTEEEKAGLAALPFELSPGGKEAFLGKTLPTNGAKAFAAAPDGAWGYGNRYHTLGNAEKAALDNCQKYSSECEIVYTVDAANPPLENGVQLSDNAFDFYQEYMTIDSAKAFAIGYGGESFNAWGSDIEEIKDYALSSCSEQMETRTYPDVCVLLDANGELQDIDQPMRPTLP